MTWSHTAPDADATPIWPAWPRRYWDMLSALIPDSKTVECRIYCESCQQH